MPSVRCLFFCLFPVRRRTRDTNAPNSLPAGDYTPSMAMTSTITYAASQSGTSTTSVTLLSILSAAVVVAGRVGAESFSFALCARSVSSLSHDNDANDEFAFRFSLPEFAALNIEARSSLSSLPCKALQVVVTHTEGDYERGNDDVANDTHNNILEYEFDDPELWERCADTCDALYEHVSSYIASEQELKSRIQHRST